MRTLAQPLRAQFLRQQSQFQDYLILQRLGQGSFGTIFKVSNLFVMKEIEVDDESTLKNCQQEMSLLKAISHQHIVKYVDSFMKSSKFYIIMEYCEKGDLNDYIQRQGTNMDIPESKIWRLILQMCLALEFIHENGVIHSDLKPQNILLTGRDQDIFGHLEQQYMRYALDEKPLMVQMMRTLKIKQLAFHIHFFLKINIPQILITFILSISDDVRIFDSRKQPRFKNFVNSGVQDYLVDESIDESQMNRSGRRQSKKMNESRVMIENQKQERRQIMISNVEQQYFTKQQSNQEFYKDILKKKKNVRNEMDKSPLRQNTINSHQNSLVQLLNYQYLASSESLNREDRLRQTINKNAQKFPDHQTQPLAQDLFVNKYNKDKS
ncbi:protein kinase domain containing protein [Stylonychia lemnae]|uniref:non-specific serine/threonine protein kinase n=1 Tax=Stylonychia lemnae TaxID=5949 RepID=A0A077ZXG6_STYLE|nr:protein kinase domain containing protein [Stylonychia lemnae]|eukprot:CDW73241.1 protein kinase domain containing protein [Stylonychia lemnae]